jgi:hypothetical protein
MSPTRFYKDSRGFPQHPTALADLRPRGVLCIVITHGQHAFKDSKQGRDCR